MNLAGEARAILSTPPLCRGAGRVDPPGTQVIRGTELVNETRRPTRRKPAAAASNGPRGARSSRTPAGAPRRVQRRGAYVFLSLVAVLTLTGGLLMATRSAPLTPDASRSLLATHGA